MTGRPRRLVLVLPNLRLGGTQQVAMKMIAYWLDCGHDVTVVTWVVKDVDHFRLPPRVNRIRIPEPPLARAARFVGRLVEGRRPVVSRQPAWTDGGRAIGLAADAEDVLGTRPLDFARAAYRAWLKRRNAAVTRIVRRRLLGRSPGAYVALMRAIDWPARRLRRILLESRPDVVVGMLSKTNEMAVVASVGLPHRTVISERNDPAKQFVDEPWEALRELLYPAADAISANSHGALETMRAYCADEKLCYVPNPLHLPAAPSEAARANAVLFLARLMPQKAPDVLVEAFARFHRRVPDWRLEIAGAGPLGQELLERANAHGLANAVTFHGVVPDPSPLLARCRIFALPSRFEGTPNALLEAMAHRAACIVSDGSPGPLRLIEHEKTGLVVKTDSVDDLAAALERLARGEPLRRMLGEAAFERVREFSIDRVAPAWDRILFPEDGAGHTVT